MPPAKNIARLLGAHAGGRLGRKQRRGGRRG